ncbi:transposase [Planctomycetales bacterium ZRK34]|nr:transposase [Planctomycetales bacterium ZRK34]
MHQRRRLRELAAARPSYGYLRLHMLLHHEGWLVNRKRVYRLYKEEGLTMRRKVPRRRVSSVRRCRRRSKRTTDGRWASCRTKCSTDGDFAS